MRKVFYFLSFVVCLAMFSCTGNSPLSFDGKWCVTSIEGEAVTPAGDTPYIKIDGTNVEGFTGCNHLTGSIDIEKLVQGEADFSNVGATMMICPEDKYETRFLAALSKVRNAKLTDKGLTLIAEDGKEVLTFEKQ